MKVLAVLATTLLVSAGMAFPAIAQQSGEDMTFFLTSTGKGNGADLGGLDGADAHCNALAKAAGSKRTSWKAYLSTTMPGGEAGVNARDRIGDGPWRNAKGVVVAQNVTELHGANNLNKNTALTEKGDIVNGRGDTPNQHDILTGSQSDGTLLMGADGAPATCSNWTAATDGMGAAQLGHVDRMGRGATGSSWNNAHPSRGCSQANLVATGGNGYLYCFAAN